MTKSYVLSAGVSYPEVEFVGERADEVTVKHSTLLHLGGNHYILSVAYEWSTLVEILNFTVNIPTRLEKFTVMCHDGDAMYVQL